MSAPPPVLAWLDLEMTGLDPADCVIVEMALILTDVHLTPLAPPLEMVIWQPEQVMATMSPFVRKMHEKSGLLNKIGKSEHGVADAEQAALKLISAHAPYRTARLCGNSIAQDRRFLFKYMPAFENFLHYRQVDVSTLKELGVWWHDLKFVKPDSGQHTALFDIQQSIAELRWYRDHLLRAKT